MSSRTPEVPILLDPGPSSVVSLRLHGAADAERVFEQCADPLSQAWTRVPVPYSRDDALRFVTEAMPAGWESGQEWAFAVDVDGRFGGTVSLRDEGDGRAEVAYGSHPDVRGTGAMERALRLLLGWGLDPAGKGLSAVIWWANRNNWASRRLAWKLGFSFDGTVRHWLPQRGELLDGWVGTLLAGDERAPAYRWLDAPRIDSPRLPLRLRAARDEDLQRLVEGASDPETLRWFGTTTTPYDDASGRATLLRQREAMAVGKALHLVAADAGDDRLLAQVSIVDIDPHLLSAEIGYWAHPDARRRGVATEATRLGCRHALMPTDEGGLGLRRVYAHAAVDNAASRVVLRAAGLAEVRVVPGGTRTRDGLRDAVLHERVAGQAS